MEASRAARQPRTRKSLRQLAPLRLKRAADPAFEQLYRKHAREVYQYALALTANPADAEDVAQTAFLNAYRAYQRGERPHKPHNWLISITHNVCRMRWRQAGSRPNEVAFDEAPEPVAVDQERPDLDAVLTALASLTFNQRAAIVMRELEGRSYQEIAGVLDLSVSAVEALLFRARRRLQLNRKALGILGTVPLPGLAHVVPRSRRRRRRRGQRRDRSRPRAQGRGRRGCRRRHRRRRVQERQGAHGFPGARHGRDEGGARTAPARTRPPSTRPSRFALT